MPDALTAVPLHFPGLYFPVAIGLAALLAETWIKRRRSWALPAAIVYVTVLAWYFVDLFITPEDYDFLPDSLLNISYAQVAAFLVIYRLVLPRFTRWFGSGANQFLERRRSFAPQTIFTAAIVLWACLLICGVTMMSGDLIGALFPIGARTGNTMWGRGAAGDAGATGFLISTGGYLYLLASASFGVWLVLLRPPPLRWLALALILVSWPFFLLSGTRSNFLAVCLPLFFAYLLFGRSQLWVRIVVLASAFGVLNFVLLVVITYRGVGFQALVAARSDDSPEGLASHQGLNMIQELCYANVFSETHPPAYGTRYLQEAVNMVPRAIWPSKPLLGIDYAAWRGFEGGDSDIGVVATVSSGVIGGGILNFGLWFGPIAPALLMAFWTALLSRWWVQRASLLRSLLFLVGLGLTFNLGRDITLLVLWPVVFGYLLVRIAEYAASRCVQRKRNAARLNASSLLSSQPLPSRNRSALQ